MVGIGEGGKFRSLTHIEKGGREEPWKLRQMEWGFRKVLEVNSQEMVGGDKAGEQRVVVEEKEKDSEELGEMGRMSRKKRKTTLKTLAAKNVKVTSWLTKGKSESKSRVNEIVGNMVNPFSHGGGGQILPPPSGNAYRARFG